MEATPEPREVSSATNSDRGDDARRRWWRSSRPPESQRQRLRSAIEALEVQLDTTEAGATPWLARAKKHLANAKEHADTDLNSGWASLNAARRQSIFGLTDVEAELEAIRVHAESKKKLSSWRGTSSELILVVQDGKLAPEMRENVRDRIFKAREILDIRNDNMYRKLWMLGNQLRVAAFQLILGIAALVLIAREGWTEDVSDRVLENYRLLLSIVTVGWLAAVMSSVIALGRRDETMRIPVMRRIGLYMALRPVGGSASAVLVVILMQTGLGGSVELTGAGVFAVAISAGFTELLITRAIGSAAKAVEGERSPDR